MILEDGAWALTEVRRRLPLYRVRRDYYNGQHRLALMTQRFRTTFGHQFRAFADNLCTVVVDAVADKLAIVAWSAGEDGDALEPANAAWKAQRLAAAHDVIVQEQLALGDAYLTVWETPEGQPAWWPGSAETCAVRYDPNRPRVRELGAKVWCDGKRWRLTLYYPDRTERYATRNLNPNGIPSDPRDFQPWQDEGGPAVVENPYGVVPLFHFANRAGIGQLGHAEHDQAIPLQDALNKSVLDGLVGAEYHSLPQRWATGLELPTDPSTGEPKSPKSGPGTLLTVDVPEARFGEFGAANLEQLVGISESYRLEIARVTGTPAHRVQLSTGAWPSGEALRVANAPLNAKVEDRQQHGSPEWASAMDLTLRIGLTPADGGAWPIWKPAQDIDPAEAVAIAESKRRVGVSQRQTLRELGYSEDEIDLMLEENAENAARLVDRGEVA